MNVEKVREIAYNVARARRQQPADAEDIAHDVVVRALCGSFSERVPRAIVRWAATLTLNVIRDRARRIRVRERDEHLVTMALQHGCWPDANLRDRWRYRREKR